MDFKLAGKSLSDLKKTFTPGRSPSQRHGSESEKKPKTRETNQPPTHKVSLKTRLGTCSVTRCGRPPHPGARRTVEPPTISRTAPADAESAINLNRTQAAPPPKKKDPVTCFRR